jgi:hypothetical protein
MSKGIPSVLADYTLVVPFNDVEAPDRMLNDRGSEIACLIMEPVMMNIGVVVPQPGYPRGGLRPLAAVWRGADLRRGKSGAPTPPVARSSGSGCSCTRASLLSAAALPSACLAATP